MYKYCPFPSRILIVKASSLGDVIQAFVVLHDLKRRFPTVCIDWAVEAGFSQIVAAHPLISRTIPIEKKKLFSSLKELRKEKYDLVFDLQGNCKSGLITLLSRGKIKIGYGLQSVREWPNILATHLHFNISKEQNIRLFYLKLLEKFFRTPSEIEIEGVYFQITDEEKQRVFKILSSLGKMKIMVCPGSRWVNKQLKVETWIAFLKRIEEEYGASFLLIWGDENEKSSCMQIASSLKEAHILDKLSIPMWQNLMNEMDFVIAVDSSALHLCSTTKTPSFSIFGPTSLKIFKPVGKRHAAIQGKCPFQKSFVKQCPILRSCPTGACVKELQAEELFAAFQNQCVFLRDAPPLIKQQ